MAADTETDVKSEAKTRFSFRETLRRLARKIPSSRSASKSASTSVPGAQSSSEPGSKSKSYGLPEKFELPSIDSGPSLLELWNREKPLPATPENGPRPAPTDVHGLAFERILDQQSLSIAEARAKLEKFDSSLPPGKPRVDMRSLRSQDGEVWGSVAPRAKSQRRNWQAEMPFTAKTAPAEELSSKAEQLSRSNSTSSTWSGETVVNDTSMRNQSLPQLGSNLTAISGTFAKSVQISIGKKPAPIELSAEIVSPTTEDTHIEHDKSAQEIKPEEAKATRARPSVVELYPAAEHTRATTR